MTAPKSDDERYDVLLIAPHQAYWEDGRPRNGAQDLAWTIPLGLLSITQFLESRGLKVRLLHLPSLANEVGEAWRLDEVLRRHPAPAVGIQAHWQLYSNGSLQVAERYRRHHPDARIYLGGTFAAALAGEIMNACPAVDGVVSGEGEVPMLELTRAAIEGRDPSTVGCCWHRTADGVQYRQPQDAMLVPLDELPLVDPSDAHFEGLEWAQTAYVNISRGLCRFNCAYCVANEKQFFRRPLTTVAVERVIAQMRIYEQLGFTELFLGESEFLFPKYVEELAEALIGAKLDLTICLETHPLLCAKPELTRRLVDAGCVRYTLGAESGSNTLLRRTGRASSQKQILAAIKAVSDQGGLALTSWICNLPGETDAEFGETLETMKQVVDLGGQIYWIENLIALPATQIANDPGRFDIELLVNDLPGWQRWSLLAKEYITREQFTEDPRAFLTHVNGNATPVRMAERLYEARYLARDLVPKMRKNADRAFADREYLHLLEHNSLDWYEETGYKLLSF